MNSIYRNPASAVKEQYNLIIIGGGIYGASLSYMASAYGLKSLLLERDDFGGATSYNSLRIIHGGLRYLQSLDLTRYFESVNERNWFLKNFPELVEPLPSLMPLYNRGLHRKSILRIALLVNDLLSINRNRGIGKGNQLLKGEIISAKKVKELFPLADTMGLKGGAVWYDGSMQNSQRILIEMLRASCLNGGSAFNYFEVLNLNKKNNKVFGVTAKDNETEKIFEFKSDIVINAAGPWSREVAAIMDEDVPNLFKSSIAWNILFNKESLSDYAIAVTPKKPNSKTFFIRPWHGKIIAGTVHEPWDGIENNPVPRSDSVRRFIEEINSCISGYNLSEKDILHIYSGLLPAKSVNSPELANREVIVDHSIQGGPSGLISVSGVKFTTARLVAEKALAVAFPSLIRQTKYRNLLQGGFSKYSFDFQKESNWKSELKRIIEEESVLHLDDLIIRRTSIGDDPENAVKLAPLICDIFNWDGDKRKNEINRINKYFKHVNLSKPTYSKIDPKYQE